MPKETVYTVHLNGLFHVLMMVQTEALINMAIVLYTVFARVYL